jgi:4-amino-4-deoxy-L-arabinose transferase-like glycosyltransferase
VSAKPRVRAGGPRKGAGASAASRASSPSPAEERAGPNPRRLALLLGGVVVLVHGLLALAAFNPAPHTGGDNASYISLAHSLLTTGTYTEVFDPERLPHTKYPPVFPALIALWAMLGARSWIALKSIPMLFSAVAVLGAYLWASERRGPVFGASVALLVGLSSATIDASHWVLSDPPFVAFTVFGLWAFERAGRAQDGNASSDDAGPARRATLYPAIGIACAVLAYFTRSAGIPLLIAVGAWLLLRRGWRALAVYAAAAGTPLLLWWLRTQSVGRATYMNEFWLLDPYDPSLGRVGIGGLVGRFGANLVGYATRYVPGGIVGAQGSWVALIGVLLVALAVWGWARAATSRLGVAELFVPLYLGLIFLWPEVWSGDRFALPLYPLLFFYAGDALTSVASRAGRAAAVGAALVGMTILTIPAFGYWIRSVSNARICSSAARSVGPYACWGAGVNEFVRIAMWSRTALPEGSAVLSRKPSIFYVMSGVPSRTFPFSLDPDVLLAEARATGARYVVLDQWDGQAMRYVGDAISRRPQAFCSVGGFDPREGGAGTLLLGLLPDAPPPQSDAPPTQISLQRCPADMLGDIAAPIPSYSSSSIPLLSGSYGGEP